MKFTAYDSDSGQSLTQNCAVTYQGGWWYKDCYCGRLTGTYNTYMWNYLGSNLSNRYGVLAARMMIRLLS